MYIMHSLLLKSLTVLHIVLVGTMVLVTIVALCVYVFVSRQRSAKKETLKDSIKEDSVKKDIDSDKHEISAGPEAALEILYIGLLSRLPVNLQEEWRGKLTPHLQQNRSDHEPTNFTWVWKQFIHWLLIDPTDGLVNIIDIKEGQEAIKLVAKLYVENCKNPMQWDKSLAKIKESTKKCTRETHFHALDVAYNAACVMRDRDDRTTASDLVDHISRLPNEIAQNIAWQKALDDGGLNSDYETYTKICNEAGRQTCVRNLEKLLELLSIT